MTAKQTAKQTDITREILLGAAFSEIHRHGFQAASVANILQSTNLTKGALYHHFATKQELGLAVIDEVIRTRLEGLVFRRLRDSAQPVQALLEVLAGMEQRTDAEAIALGCPLNNLMQEMSPLDASFKARLNAILTTWIQIVEAALRKGQASGVIRLEVDCRVAALFIVSAWEGCIGIAKNLQSPESFGSCMRQLQAYVRSLAVPGAA